MGVVPCQLDGTLDRLGARVGEEDASSLLERRDARQVLGQLQVAGLVEVGGGDVDQPIGLRLDRLDHLRVAMAGRADRDAGGEVQEAVAVHVGHDTAVAGLGHERIGPSQAGADDRVVAGDEGLGTRPRQLRDEMRRRLAGSR